MPELDVIVIGGGIVGLATAYSLLKARPELRVRLLEKEAELAQHQTGHNSGVLHSGIYYKPGSLKAQNCIAGRAAMLDFCEQERIPVMNLASGAGHDSQQIAALCPVGMVFVRSRDGRSHTPEEFSSLEDMVAGIRVLAGTLHQLAYEDA